MEPGAVKRGPPCGTTVDYFVWVCTVDGWHKQLVGSDILNCYSQHRGWGIETGVYRRIWFQCGVTSCSSPVDTSTTPPSRPCPAVPFGEIKR